MRRAWIAAAAALALAACTAGDEPGPSGVSATATWPAPAADRPVVELRFDVAEDLRSVDGRERVSFTPDLPVCELVFRSWPNKPYTARAGSSLEVRAVTVGGEPARFLVLPGGAPEGAPGTLVEVPLPRCVDAGTTVEAELDFDLTLGEGVDERVGVAPEAQVAWFGSAFPLLAWETGRGWAREDAVDVAGEVATSETFDLRSLEVLAPAGHEVLAAGESLGTAPAGQGRVHRFGAPAVRDVTVTVGQLDVLTREAGGVRVHLGAPAAGTRVPLPTWADQVERSLGELTALLGPVPYDDLWISVLPGGADGVEFPGAVQMRDTDPGRDRWLVTHELAHMWFYGLVGNNQGRDPWIDESFTSMVQRVADEPDQDPAPSGEALSPVADEVGRPMRYWTRFDRPSAAYVQAVYVAGADALLRARGRVGAEAFDAALRGYLRDNAHQVVEPADVRRAFEDLPAVLVELREAGALRG
ncbi:M1 family aminopeptidase [Georgenia sp. AZ-5]|uniref:M1 family aminopeptidase n=1 Tax=Georgenia sp. AZ-5 TaxID=3367526 RepID=UPI00375515B1